MRVTPDVVFPPRAIEELCMAAVKNDPIGVKVRAAGATAQIQHLLAAHVADQFQDHALLKRDQGIGVPVIRGGPFVVSRSTHTW
jgi:hypothetical protein